MIFPEDVIAKKFFKGEITYEEAEKQLKFLIDNLEKDNLEKSRRKLRA